MYEKVKIWLKKQWKPLKKFVKKNWFLIINYLVIIIAYSNVYEHEDLVGTETLLGLWIFASVVYGAFKWFMTKK